MSQTIKDFITTFSGQDGTPQTVTAAAVSEDVINFNASPAGARMIGLKNMHVEFVVGTTWTGLASGIRFEVRADSNANLNTAQVIVGVSPIILIADLVAGDRIIVPIAARELASTITYMGAWYAVVSESATAGTIFASLKQGPVSIIV